MTGILSRIWQANPDESLLDPTGMGRPPKVGYLPEPPLTAEDLPPAGQLTPLAAFIAKALATDTPGLAPAKPLGYVPQATPATTPGGSAGLPPEALARIQKDLSAKFNPPLIPEGGFPPSAQPLEEYAGEARIVVGPNGVPLLTNRTQAAGREWSPGSAEDRKARADTWIASQREANPPPPTPGPPDVSMAAVEGRIRAANQLNRLWGAEAGPRMAEQELETGRLQERQKQDVARLTPEQRHAWELEKEVAAHPEGQIAQRVAQLSEKMTQDPEMKAALLVRQAAELKSAGFPNGPAAWFQSLKPEEKEQVVTAYYMTNALNAYIANMLRANRARVDENQQNPFGGFPQGAMNAPIVQDKY